MGIQSRTWEGYQLLHDGIEAFADIEQNGMCIDLDYCLKQQKHLGTRINYLKKRVGKTREVRKWKNKYGRKFNLGSDDQMADILFNTLGYTPKIFTDSTKPSVSQEALEVLDTPFIHDIVLMRKMEKASGTFLEGLIREQVDGFLHPFFHLHIARTIRGSSSNINFQNQPKRDKMMKKAIRRGIVTRKDHCLGELDYSGVEVTSSTFYHKDPTMIDDIIDPTKDMHRDMAMKCFLLDGDEWTKGCRQAAKNGYVFPQFYGSWYKECGINMWFATVKDELITAQGVPLRKHLKKHGISNEGQFIKHIQGVEDYFWNERYKVYGQWKKKNWKDYLKNGYVDILSGFRLTEIMSQNDCNNYPIQGAAFHCLLWSLTQLNKWLKKNKMKSVIIGQIHDSIVMDLHRDEINVVLAKAKWIMEVAISQHWKWIIVPFKVDIELSPMNTNWYQLDEVEEFKCNCGLNYAHKIKDQFGDYYKCPVCGKETLT